MEENSTPGTLQETSEAHSKLTLCKLNGKRVFSLGRHCKSLFIVPEGQRGAKDRIVLGAPLPTIQWGCSYFYMKFNRYRIKNKLKNEKSPTTFQM